MNRKSFFISIPILIFSFFPFAGYGQSLLSEKSLNLETSFAIEIFNSENGLPQNSVIDIMQALDGYVWLSTNNGLVKFDGLKFTVYNTQNAPGLSSNAIIQIAQSADSVLWLLDDAGNMSTYNGLVFAPFDREQTSLRVRSITADASGLIVFSTFQNDVYRIRGLQIEFITRINQSELISVKRGPRNSLLMLTTKGFFVWENNTLVPYDDLSGGSVYSAAYDTDNAIWVCSSIGIFKITGTESDAINLPDVDLKKPVKIYIARNNSKWFYSDNGLHLYEENEFTTFGEEQGLSSSAVNKIFEDKEDNIWVGTQNAGLNKLRHKIFRCFSQEDGLINDGVAPILRRFDGSVWVGNNCGGINKIVQGKIIKYEIPENKCVISLMEDEEGFIWIGTYGSGVYKYVESKLIKHYNKYSGLYDEVVGSLVEDREHTVWAGTDKGVWTIRGDTVRKFRGDIIKSKVNYILYDSRQQFWVATNSGLFLIKDIKSKSTEAVSGIPAGIVRTVAEDSTGTIWVGTGGSGLFRIKDGKAFSYKDLTGILDDEIFAIAEDGAHRFWLSSNRGIYAVMKQELNDYADGKIKSVTVSYFDRKDGLKTNEFNTGFQPNFFRESDDKIWFPTIKGIAIVNRQLLHETGYTPMVRIESCRIDNTDYILTNGLIIPRTAKLIELSFTAPRLHHPDKVFFQYRLDGYDAGWSAPVNKRTVQYYNLKPGNYDFKVRLWNNPASEKTVTISIPLPFWMSRWFIVSAYIAAVCVLGLIMYARLKYISRRQQQEAEISKNFAALELKALQAQMNPHFIFNCLNTIKYFITTKNHDAANKYLGKFSKLLRMFLEHSKSTSITLDDEINLLRLYIELEQMRFYEGFNFHLQVESELDVKNIDIPGTLFQPFVENAINHGLVNLKQKGNLTITFKIENDYLVGIVDDDGIGRRAAMELKNQTNFNHTSHGVHLIEERIKTLNFIKNADIKMEVHDKVNADGTAGGTEVVIRIPIFKN